MEDGGMRWLKVKNITKEHWLARKKRRPLIRRSRLPHQNPHLTDTYYFKVFYSTAELKNLFPGVPLRCYNRETREYVDMV